MVADEQTNQDPEVSTQDANSEKLVQSSTKVKQESALKADNHGQIDDDLKKEIVALIHNEKSKSPKNSAAQKVKDEQDKVSEKPEKDLYPANTKAAKEETSAKPKNKKSPKAQISKAEKKGIVSLFRDDLHKQLAGAEDEKVSKKLEKEVHTAKTKLAEEESKAEPKKKKSSKSQISKAEKPGIVSLFSDDLHKQLAIADSSDDDIEESSEEDIDYEHLNKQELVELLEEVVEEKDISKIKSQVSRIKSSFYLLNREEIESEKQDFIAAGGNAEDFAHNPDPLEQRFDAAFGIYRHSKANFAEQLEKQKQENYHLKLKILDDLKELIDSEETLKKTYDEFNRLQTDWKEIGMVPAAELNDLWQNYHFLVERFFDKIRINKELRDLDLKKNLEQKVVLCEKAEELLLEKSILRSFKLLQKYHDEWREIGPVPMEDKEAIWERFKNASDKINARRKEYYKALQEEQQTNYDAKVALCEKVEELMEQNIVTFNDWQKKTKEINDIFKVWKTIGRAPRAQNDEIWNRFKVSLDGFFENKREFLGKLKEQQLNNLNLKIDLCVQAESMKDSDDWKNTTRDLIRLQQEWKKIGPVPRRQSEKVWKRFRTSCDHFFNRKSDYFKNIHVVEDENLKKKKDLIKAISELKISQKKSENLEAAKDFQRQWMEIGHVPFKVKDEIQKQYREVIDKLFDKMDVNKFEMTKAGFQNKVEMLKNSPDGNRKLSQERYHLANKVAKIKEEVTVWENNIGFFANSKQSELLRREFELKIDKAKKEIAELEAQIKILDKE